MPTVDSKTAILIRVPTDLKEWVEQEARDHRRSISQEVRQLIEMAQRERTRRREKNAQRLPMHGLKRQPARKPQGQTRCPQSFVPRREVVEWAQAHFPNIDILRALEAMRAHEYARPHTDWNGALRTWIRNTDTFGQRQYIGAKRNSEHMSREACMNEMVDVLPRLKSGDASESVSSSLSHQSREGGKHP